MDSDANGRDAAFNRFGDSIEDLDEDAVLASEDDDEVDYVCDSCGEPIVIPIDVSAGTDQEYVEDCPVCCTANVIRVHLTGGGDESVEATVEARLE